jgi:hypothetical protein
MSQINNFDSITIKINQIQEQLTNFTSKMSFFTKISGYLDNLTRYIPIIFISIIYYIKNVYGDKNGIDIVLAILLIFFILYLTFSFASTGCLTTVFLDTKFQGLAIAGFGGLIVNTPLLNPNNFLEKIYIYLITNK